MKGIILATITCHLLNGDVPCEIPRSEEIFAECASLRRHMNQLPLDERGDPTIHVIIKHDNAYVDCGEYGDGL